jgi:glycosyltransferase involved in cell wall biosynthesis
MGVGPVLRVLHVAPYFAPAFAYGGPPRNILGLCRALQRTGVDVQVFTTTAGGAARAPLAVPHVDRYAGVPVRYFPHAFPRRVFGARGLGAALGSDLPGYDLAHVHGLWHLPGWTTARLARKAGRPYVISPRGMLDPGSVSHHARRKRLAYRLVERRLLGGAALLHAGSADEARTLADHGGPVVTLPNGVDVPESEVVARGSFRQRLGLATDVPMIVFLGRIHPQKRLDLLAAAFAEVSVRQPSAHLVIAGPDDGDRRRVEPLFAPLGRAVHWLGEVMEPSKWALLADADALVMCSESESFGSSALEALAAGVPVVVTRSCPWEEVEREGCGFWVTQDAGAIAAGLLALLSERGRARAMGEKGRALARAKYSWDVIGRGMADQYRAVIARRHARVAAP